MPSTPSFPRPNSVEQLVLYEPRRNALLSVGVFAAITAIGIAVGTRVGDGIGILGWVIAAFFGACALGAMVTVFKRDGLVLTRNGLTFSAASQRFEYRWPQIQGVYTFERRSVIGPPRMVVGIDFVPGEAGPFDSTAARWADRVTMRPGTSTRVVKGDAGALPSMYGLSADELVNLLEGWRRANRAGDPQRSETL